MCLICGTGNASTPHVAEDRQCGVGCYNEHPGHVQGQNK